MTRLVPAGFAVQTTTAPQIGVDITVTGAKASANHGFVLTANQVIPRFRPLGFSTQASDYVGRGLGDNVEVTLTGAKIEALATSLLGAQTVIVPDGGEAEAEAGLSKFLFDSGVTIENASAVDGVTNYEIDDRTGFKVYPAWHPLSKTKEDGYGWRTREGDARHPQEFVKSRGNDKQRGPQNPEPSDSFISTSVGPEDL